MRRLSVPVALALSLTLPATTLAAPLVSPAKVFEQGVAVQANLAPEMSAEGITTHLLASLERNETDVYIVNFANADMVGHTGIYEAASRAVAKIDSCLQRIVPAALARGATIGISGETSVTDLFTEIRVPLLSGLPFADSVRQPRASRHTRSCAWRMPRPSSGSARRCGMT